MAPPDTPRTDPPDSPSSVPDLVTDYRSQVDVLRAQARNVALMRADVLSAAARESQAIVAAARRDIRDILVNARRELLVLAAQVEAVTERSDTLESPGARARLLEPGPLTSEEAERANAPAEARQEVREVLSEVRPDLERLADEARVLRTNLRQRDSTERRAAAAGATETVFDTPAPVAVPSAPAPAPTMRSAPERTWDTVSTGLLTDLPPPTRPSKSWGRRVVVAVAASGVLALIGTTWWWYAGTMAAQPAGAAGGEAATALPEPSPIAVVASPLPPDTTTPTPEAAAPVAELVPSLTIEAKRTSWIRAQVDGKPDPGRTFYAGEKRRIVGATRVVLRAGDAGAVFVTINDGQPEAVGVSGQPQTREYFLDGGTRPLPEAAATPTPETARPSEPTGFQPNAATAPAPAPPPRPTPTRTVAGDGDPTVTEVAPTPAPAPATQPPAAQSTSASSSGPTGVSSDEELAELSRRWLDAYLAGLVSSLPVIAGGTPTIRDERPLPDRVASGLATSKRSFSVISVQNFAGLGTVSTRVVEQSQRDGQPQERALLAAQTWTRREGKWQLIDVRLLSESQVKTP
jgi:hypothetical protein